MFWVVLSCRELRNFQLQKMWRISRNISLLNKWWLSRNISIRFLYQTSGLWLATPQYIHARTHSWCLIGAVRDSVNICYSSPTLRKLIVSYPTRPRDNLSSYFPVLPSSTGRLFSVVTELRGSSWTDHFCETQLGFREKKAVCRFGKGKPKHSVLSDTFSWHHFNRFTKRIINTSNCVCFAKNVPNDQN